MNGKTIIVFLVIVAIVIGRLLLTRGVRKVERKAYTAIGNNIRAGRGNTSASAPTSAFQKQPPTISYGPSEGYIQAHTALDFTAPQPPAELVETLVKTLNLPTQPASYGAAMYIVGHDPGGIGIAYGTGSGDTFSAIIHTEPHDNGGTTGLYIVREWQEGVSYTASANTIEKLRNNISAAIQMAGGAVRSKEI